MSPYWKYKKFVQYNEHYINKFKHQSNKKFKKYELIWSLVIFSVIITVFFQIVAFRISPVLSFNLITFGIIFFGLRKYLSIQKQTYSFIQEYENALIQLRENPDDSLSYDDLILKHHHQFKSIYNKYFTSQKNRYLF